MLKSRSRKLAIVVTAGALSLIGAAGASARVPDRPQKGIAPLCLAGAPAAECKEGPIS
jgi:hypothetical protein